MGYIVKVILISALLLTVGALVNGIINITFMNSINNAIIYFLSALAPVDYIIPMDAVYTAIQVLGNVIFAGLSFLLVWRLIHLYK
jgi:hypothetical protein